MINVEYTVQQNETAKATFDFLVNRPFLKILVNGMKVGCVFLTACLALVIYNKAAQPQDFVSVIFALAWLFYYKPINRWIIRNKLKKIKFENLNNLFKIDRDSIFYQPQNSAALDIKWKSLKYILKNDEGYIIPLTGMSNAGKFLWLPFRGFKSEATKQEFIDLVQNFNLKIKNI